MFSFWTKSTAVAIALGVLSTAVLPNQVQAREDWYETKGAHVGYGLLAGVVIGSALSNSHRGDSRVSYDYSYNSGRHYRSGSSFSYSYSSSPRYYRSSCHTPYRSSYRSSYTYYEPAPVVYYEPQPVYYSQPAPVAVQPGSYINYRQKSAFPFYKKTEIEVIPPLPVVNPDRPQAVNNVQFSQSMRQMYSTNKNRSAADEAQTPEAATQPQSSAVQEVTPSSYQSSNAQNTVQNVSYNQPRPVQEREVRTVSNRAGSVSTERVVDQPVSKTTPDSGSFASFSSERNEPKTQVISASYRY